uniref:26S proteasome non-ATPase regulatory subunit 13 n=1 Tax=Moina brachiata TaxID=675436 RepID=A0A4Y7NIN3_9CRUS|nr:EOG090X05V9 [Moina brachiata]SVE93002.1 EOG090X05V9 [Moina brachiata]
MRDVPKFLSSKQNTSDQELAAEWSKLEGLYNKKLWHQLTIELLSFIKHPSLQENNELVQLYENFVADFENKINLLSLTEICVAVVKQIPSVDEQLVFLKQLQDKVKANKQALALCKVLTGNIVLHQKGDHAETKNLIEEIEKILDETDGVTPVHGRFYSLCSDLYRIQAKHADYYRASLRFLGCTDINTLSATEQKNQAFHLGIAALLGEGIYNLGELLAHPVLDALKNQEESWLVDLLYVMNAGDIAGFHKLKPRWSSQTDLLANERTILQKITLLALMEMTFKRPATKRNLSFQEIASTTGAREDEVELLVMKALAQGLLKGTIDQVDSTAHFTWVQPRVLDKKQLSTMMTRLEHWCKDIESVETLVETKANDILTL